LDLEIFAKVASYDAVRRVSVTATRLHNVANENTNSDTFLSFMAHNFIGIWAIAVSIQLWSFEKFREHLVVVVAAVIVYSGNGLSPLLGIYRSTQVNNIIIIIIVIIIIVIIIY